MSGLYICVATYNIETIETSLGCRAPLPSSSAALCPCEHPERPLAASEANAAGVVERALAKDD